MSDKTKYIQTREESWTGTPKGTIYIETGNGGYIQPEKSKLIQSPMGIDLQLSDDNYNNLFEEIIYGSECCGEKMTLASSGIVFECNKCGNWEYSSS